jgi:hypothetical protein
VSTVHTVFFLQRIKQCVNSISLGYRTFCFAGYTLSLKALFVNAEFLRYQQQNLNEKGGATIQTKQHIIASLLKKKIVSICLVGCMCIFDNFLLCLK